MNPPNQPDTDYPQLTGQELRALKLAAHRQLSRSADRELRPRQQARRDALLSAVRILDDRRLSDGCQLRPTANCA